MGFYATQF
ncbi:hypothetical protein CP8484711_0293, partial [Chlamydia psittaci 84-8471/1]